MSTLSIVPQPINTCQFPLCNKPLGHDSKEQGYLVCLEHRICTKCGRDLQPTEVKLCLDTALENNESIEIAHPRCKAPLHKTATEDPTLSIKQSEYDRLNILRLMIYPDMELAIVTNESNAMIQSARVVSDMDWDQKYAHLKMLEACVAQVSIALAQDRKKLKERATERDKVKTIEARKQAETSSRPANKPADDEKEALLAAFMAKNCITERGVAIKIKRDRDKAIQGFMTLGIPEDIATQTVDSDLVKRGILKQ